MGVRAGGVGELVADGDVWDDLIIMDDRLSYNIKPTDDLAWYGEPTNSIKLIPMEFYGYTVPILQNTGVCDSMGVFDNNKREYDSFDDLMSINYYRNESGMLKDVRLFDTDGNDVFSNFRNLTHNNTYTLKWSENGTEYEEQLKASWCYYKPTGSGAITLSGTETDDTEVIIYDFSSVPSGLYCIVESNFAIVEIKND